ncbi:L,D-transpeptidase family protein [Streptomyces sp. NPDC047024]|uniref:L,D-transpeptidase family protein n=1 Tax=Streptomyces sp. NPDC047024 TaxID=3155476 RepID=UPI0033FC0848
MEPMRTSGAMRAITAMAGGVLITAGVTGCGGGSSHQGKGAAHAHTDAKPRETALKRVPGVGDRLWRQVPPNTRQIVAVFGDGKDSADSTVALYEKTGQVWKQERTWSAHNGRKGWTTDHHEDDKRSPVGVFTLSDAGGVLASPGAKLPYTRSAAFQAPHYWKKTYWNDFDYVIAIDYNRVKGTPPNDPTRPGGQSKGGNIWLHMDHGSGTSACVSQSKADMEYLLRTLDPALHPVVVMGDRAELRA